MLKKTLLSAIFATTTFTLAGAEPPADSNGARDEAGQALDVAPSGKREDPAASPGLAPDSRASRTIEQDAPPPREENAQRDIKPDRDPGAKKEKHKRTKDEDIERQQSKGAVEGEPDSPSTADRADKKREERERAKAQLPEDTNGQTAPKAAEPTGESENRGAEEKRPEKASPDAKAEKRRQPSDTPAQADGRPDPNELQGEKPAQEDAERKTTQPPQKAERDRTDEDKSSLEKRDPDQSVPREALSQPEDAQGASEEKKQAVMPADEQKAKEVIREERAKADDEFEKARESAKAAAASSKDAPRVDERATSKFEAVRKERRERVEQGGVALIEEPDKRVIVRQKDRAFIQHDESARFSRSTKELRRERRPDGTTIVVNLGIGGVEITSIFNDDGQLLRRSRHDRDREIVLIDNSEFYRRHRGRRYVDAYVDLPPLELSIPREKYVVDYDDASEEDVYDALFAPPLERLDRSYSLEEVRQSYRLRERMRRVDLDAINFAFASWEVEPDQYPKLENIADAMKRIIERNPDEVFMIEGHTDAVGSDIDNLSLSDRRAETVAIVLSDTFRVPPENLTTQGYGEQFLKVATEAPSRVNRRVAVRRVTPLLSRSQRQSLER